MWSRAAARSLPSLIIEWTSRWAGIPGPSRSRWMVHLQRSSSASAGVEAIASASRAQCVVLEPAASRATLK